MEHTSFGHDSDDRPIPPSGRELQEARALGFVLRSSNLKEFRAKVAQKKQERTIRQGTRSEQQKPVVLNRGLQRHLDDCGGSIKILTPEQAEDNALRARLAKLKKQIALSN